MAAYEVLLLNTAIPQIQAAQAGDTYVVPRDIAFSTVASLAAGTEALPSLVATGDVNTGFWFPAADTIAASTGGTRRLTLDSSGNLGIGTSSPGAKLEVAASGSSQQLRLVSTGNSVFRTRWIDATTGFTLESNNTTETAYYPFTLTGSVLRFNTGAGSLAMTLDSSGNLALGATSATLRADIIGSGTVTSGTMYGVARIAQDNTTKRGVVFGYDTSGQIGTIFTDSAGAASNLAFWTYSGSAWGERARITSDGNLSLGGTADRATTIGTKALNIFDGTAPVGTLANGISLYSSSGEAYVMDAAGNATLFSPHDSETNEWIFKSKHTPSGKVLKIDVEKMLRFINDHFGLDAIHEFTEE